MFFIFEVQAYDDGTGAVLPAVQKATRQEAESAYHQILAFAATSEVANHGAIIIDEECFPIMYKSYRHGAEDDEDKDERK